MKYKTPKGYEDSVEEARDEIEDHLNGHPPFATESEKNSYTWALCRSKAKELLEEYYGDWDESDVEDLKDRLFVDPYSETDERFWKRNPALKEKVAEAIEEIDDELGQYDPRDAEQASKYKIKTRMYAYDILKDSGKDFTRDNIRRVVETMLTQHSQQ